MTHLWTRLIFFYLNIKLWYNRFAIKCEASLETTLYNDYGQRVVHTHICLVFFRNAIYNFTYLSYGRVCNNNIINNDINQLKRSIHDL